MSTAKSNVLIGKTAIDPYRLTIQQKFDDHHSFEMAVAAEKLKEKTAFLLTSLCPTSANLLKLISSVKETD